jgi:hypothetical protein
MSAAALPLGPYPAARVGRQLRLVPPAEARPRRGTLDEVIASAWAGVSARAPVACPVCDAPMAPTLTEAGTTSGSCRSCGTTLS